MYGITETGAGVLTQLVSMLVACFLLVKFVGYIGSIGYRCCTSHTAGCPSEVEKTKLHAWFACSLLAVSLVQVDFEHFSFETLNERVRTRYGHCLGTFP